MRKVFAFILSMIILIGSAIAELPDLSSLSFEELNSMKQAVDMEFNSRPESEGFSLLNGSYLIGRDIAPGTYYCSVIEPTDNTYAAYCYFYSDEETFKSDRSYNHESSSYYQEFILAKDARAISLNENEIIDVVGCKLFIKSTPYSVSDYCTYKFPNGTLVPEGTYIIGKDIPAGKYTVYPAKYGSSRFQVYLGEKDESGEPIAKYGEYGWIYLNTLNPIDSQMIEVEDGETFEAVDDVILTKSEGLKFN